jgi:hypothetical protein
MNKQTNPECKYLRMQEVITHTVLQWGKQNQQTQQTSITFAFANRTRPPLQWLTKLKGILENALSIQCVVSFDLGTLKCIFPLVEVI